MVVIAELVSLGLVSWVMASEYTFEDEPPFHQLSKNESGHACFRASHRAPPGDSRSTLG